METGVRNAGIAGGVNYDIGLFEVSMDELGFVAVMEES